MDVERKESYGNINSENTLNSTLSFETELKFAYSTAYNRGVLYTRWSTWCKSHEHWSERAIRRVLTRTS